MSFVFLSSNILLLKKIGMLAIIEKVQQNYLFITILFKIKFTIKFSLSLYLSLSLSLSLYIYIYNIIFFFNWLRHPIIFNISFVHEQVSIVFTKSCHCSKLPKTWNVLVLEFWTIWIFMSKWQNCKTNVWSLNM